MKKTGIPVEASFKEWRKDPAYVAAYNGIPKSHFHLFLKECEWRFNHRPTSNFLRIKKEWAKI